MKDMMGLIHTTAKNKIIKKDEVHSLQYYYGLKLEKFKCLSAE
jgi:hypothetical protein